VMQRDYRKAPLSYDYDEVDDHKQKSRNHWVFYAGIIFTIMLVGWLLFTALAGFIQTKMNDITYGTPRTYQVDQDVGHYGRLSHFICLNLNGYVEVIETQKGHPEASKIYPIVSLPEDQASVPITITFQDINGDGKLDAL